MGGSRDALEREERKRERESSDGKPGLEAPVVPVCVSGMPEKIIISLLD